MRILSAVPALLGMLANAQDPGRVYIYAQTLTAARSWLAISLDHAVAASTRRGTFFAVTTRPGRHVVSVENGIPAFVDVATGDEAYVRLDWNFRSIGRPFPSSPWFHRLRQAGK